MNWRSITLSCVAGLLALGGGCVRDRDTTDNPRIEIEETKDRAAKERMNLEEKNRELATSGGDTAAERARFADETEKTLRELDEKIAELRTRMQERADQAGGERGRDLEQQLRDLDSARAQAQAALESFRRQGAAASPSSQQQTQTEVDRTRAAYDALHGRLHGDDPAAKSVEPTRK